MATGPVNAQDPGAERLKGLVARWRNLAESRDQDGQRNSSGWAGHLKKVADAHDRREKENSSETLDVPLPVDKSVADRDNSHAFLRPTLRPLAP